MTKQILTKYSIDMALDTSLIVAAMTANAGAGDTQSQHDAAQRLAQAIVDTIKLAEINYTSGLLDSTHAAVTGSLLVATLS